MDEQWDDEEDDDEGEEEADPLCDLCFGEGGWGNQDEGWTECPNCFPVPKGRG